MNLNILLLFFIFNIFAATIPQDPANHYNPVNSNHSVGFPCVYVKAESVDCLDDAFFLHALKGQCAISVCEDSITQETTERDTLSSIVEEGKYKEIFQLHRRQRVQNVVHSAINQDIDVNEEVLDLLMKMWQCADTRQKKEQVKSLSILRIIDHIISNGSYGLYRALTVNFPNQITDLKNILKKIDPCYSEYWGCFLIANDDESLR